MIYSILGLRGASARIASDCAAPRPFKLLLDRSWSWPQLGLMLTAPKYPKTYGTIVQRDEWSILVRPDGQAKPFVWLNLAWRCGRGSTGSFVAGVRVKVYARPQDSHAKFRKVGS